MMIWLHVEYNSLRESMDELLITSRDQNVPDFDSIDYWETSTGSHVCFFQFMIHIYIATGNVWDLQTNIWFFIAKYVGHIQFSVVPPG